MDVASYNQQVLPEQKINYREYLRRVSKYDIDRAQVDFKKIHQEKMRDRVDNVKIKREEVEKVSIIKHKQEVEDKDDKIHSLA